MVIFHSYVKLPEGIVKSSQKLIDGMLFFTAYPIISVHIPSIFQSSWVSRMKGLQTYFSLWFCFLQFWSDVWFQYLSYIYNIYICIIYACSFLISFFMGSNCGFEFQYGCGYDWKISCEYLWYFFIVLDMVLHYVVFLSWPVLEMCL